MTDAETFVLPAGTVTFLLSDIEGSTRLWEAHPDAMPGAVAEHYAILGEAVARRGGVRPVEQGEGDSIVAAFSRASDALAAALDAQLALRAREWPGGVELRVRIALHTAEALLRDEGNYFGVALSRCARLRAIAHGGQTVVSHATSDLVADRLPDGVTLVDCGVHRLRDLGRPEQVYALAHPDLPSDLGPLRSLDVLPNNLPDRLSTFVGRERELADVRTALSEARLLTLTGAGGCGKTRLALQLAADVLDRFEDGAWWVELAPLTDGDRVADALAGALGVQPLPGMTVLQAVTAFLASRQALVVLDNCEHLLDASSALAAAVLEAAPGVSVLATSRAPLGVAGETDWRVPSLSSPPVTHAVSVEAVAQFDAVRLFIDRALKVRPNFAVTNENAPVIAQLCEDLDGIPLAIELAAARVRLLSVEQITAALSDRFRLLTGGARGVLPRQQTLRASVDWSHELLSSAERVLLRRLGVFAGGFTLDAAEDVCADDALDRLEVLDVLGGLVEKSLVSTEERGAVVRYQVLETVRQYALERLADAGELGELRDRHRDAFLALAERTGPGIENAERGRSLGLLTADAANLVGAIDRALATDPGITLRMCAALANYWVVSGRIAEGVGACEAALALADPAPTLLRARGMVALARCGVQAGGEQGLDDARAAIEAAEACGDDALLARALCTIALREHFCDPFRAFATLERAIACACQSGDDTAHAEALGVHAGARFFAGDHVAASRELDELEPLVEGLGHPDERGRLGFYRALVAVDAAQFAQARNHYERARDGLTVYQPTLDALLDIVIGLVEAYEGTPATALERLIPALDRALAAGVGMAALALTQAISEAEIAAGRLEDARSRLRGLIPQTEELLVYIGIFSLIRLAEVERLLGNTDASRTTVKRAIAVAVAFGNPVLVGWARLPRARLEADAEQWSAAEVDLLACVDACLVSRRRMLPETLEELARVASGLKSHAEAARLLGAADAARTSLRLPRPAVYVDRFAVLGAELSDALGRDAFDAAHNEGAALSLDEAVEWVRRARGERKRPPGGWESLTPTELRVVEHAAEGLSNAAIGGRMFISPATVKAHLGHVYAKLGVPNRAALATVRAEHRAAEPERGASAR